MGKRILNLYMDDELIALAKSRGYNMSELISNMLKIELDLYDYKENKTHDEVIELLKKTVAGLNTELTKRDKEIKQLNKRIKELEEKIAKKAEKPSKSFIIRPDTF